MAVLAECNDCGTDHPIGDRPLAESSTTTVCPRCGSSSYTSVCVDADLEVEREAIVDRVADAPGVGNGTAENLAAHFLTVDRLENALLEDFLDVPGMGKKNAQALADHLW